MFIKLYYEILKREKICKGKVYYFFVIKNVYWKN